MEVNGGGCLLILENFLFSNISHIFEIRVISRKAFRNANYGHLDVLKIKS